MSRYVFKVPDLGEGTVSSEIVAWRVKVGDVIEEDAPLVEMSTEESGGGSAHRRSAGASCRSAAVRATRLPSAPNWSCSIPMPRRAAGGRCGGHDCSGGDGGHASSARAGSGRAQSLANQWRGGGSLPPGASWPRQQPVGAHAKPASISRPSPAQGPGGRIARGDLDAVLSRAPRGCGPGPLRRAGGVRRAPVPTRSRSLACVA